MAIKKHTATRKPSTKTKARRAEKSESVTLSPEQFNVVIEAFRVAIADVVNDIEGQIPFTGDPSSEVITALEERLCRLKRVRYQLAREYPNTSRTLDWDSDRRPGATSLEEYAGGAA